MPLPMESIQWQEPAIRIHRGWQWGESRQVGKGAERRTVATRKGLVGSLHVVVLHEGAGDGSGLLEGSGLIEGQALLLIAAMVPFDKRVLLGMMRLADLDLDAQTGPKAQEGCRKIAALRAAYPACIPIQGNPLGATVLRQGTGQRFPCRFGGEIGAHMGIEAPRGSRVATVERFDHMLPLALWISRHAGHILEIDLPGTHRAG